MVFRTTSPQAPQVVIPESLILRIHSCRSPLRTPCIWNPWRVVIRSVPLPSSPAMRSWARYCCAVNAPPGNLERTMNIQALSRCLLFPRHALVTIVLLISPVEL